VKYDISFIHTGQVHIEKFAALAQELASQLIINHVVDESLLIHAQKFGVDEKLKANLTSHLIALSKVSKVIVVTCSSIGGIAENIGLLNGCHIQRIDQAMSDFAVQNGHNILVAAAVESTLEPTGKLLEDSMFSAGTTPKITFLYIEKVWDYFIAGQMDKYYQEIGNVLISKEENYDLIVLSQASMSGVENNINLSIPIVSSPRLGVQRAISTLII
jgi:hypothetical protein